MLKLFAVRTVEYKEAVGVYWTPDLATLWWMIDEVTDPGACEYCLVDAPAAVTWAGEAPAIGVEREDIEDEIDDREALARVKGWTRIPDEPGGSFPEILREWYWKTP